MVNMIIFDLDGTLINTLGGIAGACNYVLEQHNYETKSIESYMEFVGNGLSMTLFRALPESKQQELLSTINPDINKKELRGEPDFESKELKSMVTELLEFYSKNPIKDTFLYKGIVEVLDYLKTEQIPWGIHTNKTAAIAKDVANAFFDNRDYVGLKGPDTHVARKPNPQGSLMLIQDQNNIDLSHVLYVGDTEVDIATARNLGLPIISVSYGFRKREILESLSPDYLVDSPSMLLELIQKLRSY